MKCLGHHLRNIVQALDPRAPLADLLEHIVHERRIIYAMKRFHVGFERHRARNVHER
jgi:hypothetical protein